MKYFPSYHRGDGRDVRFLGDNDSRNTATVSTEQSAKLDIINHTNTNI